MSSIDYVNKSILNPSTTISRRRKGDGCSLILNEAPEVSHSQPNIARQPKLATKSSKLELIDNTILTSLPLPPPAKARKTNDDDYNDSAIINTTCDMSFDESYDVGDDPIVLVEDYVQRTVKLPLGQKRALEHAISRKQSLDVFKKRLYKYETLSLLSCNSTFLSDASKRGKRKISEELTNSTGTFDTKPQEDIEEIFGKIPGSDNLKYCDICNKPLYEISTVISNNKQPKTSTLPMKSSLYKEFVCWECVDTYEEFFNELYWTESKTYELPDNHSNEKLLKLFQDILDKYCITHKKFSPLLLGTLHHHLDHAESLVDLAWLEKLRQKLRWRWRLNGLIPNPFASQPH